VVASVNLPPVKLPVQLSDTFRAPRLTRTRIWLALAVAVVADGLQLVLLPFAWTFVESFIDVVAMILTMWLLGFHLLLLPTFVVEFIPVVDMLPTWTACTLAVIALRKREERKAPVPPATPPKPTIEI
jgi:hypothetical protein